jgi:glucuronosyltransferase
LLDTLNKGFTHPNLKRIAIEGAYDHGLGFYDLDQLAERASLKDGVDLVYQFYTLSCEKIMFSPTIQEFARDFEKESFDLIVQDGSNCECMLGFVELLGRPPLILATPFGSPQFVLHKAGNFDNPSYVPKHMTPFTQPLDFYQRLGNTLLSLYQAYVDTVPYTRHQNGLAKRFFGESLPPVEEIARNATLFLVNSNVLLDGVRPTLPAVVSIGGFHITTSHSPLPQVSILTDYSTLA